jgi:vacuolar-type H+-ATPase subunit F/Vma7
MRIAVIGAQAAIAGYGLAGALVRVADDPVQVVTAWKELPADVEIVIVTAVAAEALGDLMAPPSRPMVAVMPP